MQPGGDYVRLKAGQRPVSSQEEFMETGAKSVDFDSVFHVSYAQAVNGENVPEQALREGQPPAESGLREGDSALREL